MSHHHCFWTVPGYLQGIIWALIDPQLSFHADTYEYEAGIAVLHSALESSSKDVLIAMGQQASTLPSEWQRLCSAARQGIDSHGADAVENIISNLVGLTLSHTCSLTGCFRRTPTPTHLYAGAWKVLNLDCSY